MLLDLAQKNRSYRRFYENEKISQAFLLHLIELARYAPSGQNRQALRFFVSNNPQTNATIFSALTWAFYLKNWQGPEAGERPAAYIIVLSTIEPDRNIYYDTTLAVQTMLLGAVEGGYGGCMFGAVKREFLQEELRLKGEIMLVVALGKPKETVIIEDYSPGDDIRYYRDAQNNHHVPKRKREDLLSGTAWE